MIDELTDDELRDRALDVLTRHLGPAQTFRFLSWMRQAPRDYQAWRDAHFQNLNVDELLKRVRELESEP
ncbi:MAG: hypothetical protein HRF43_14920 [Phycisphaerae bacterium]|jgi:hypothetical protein